MDLTDLTIFVSKEDECPLYVEFTDDGYHAQECAVDNDGCNFNDCNCPLRLNKRIIIELKEDK